MWLCAVSVFVYATTAAYVVEDMIVLVYVVFGLLYCDHSRIDGGGIIVYMG